MPGPIYGCSNGQPRSLQFCSRSGPCKHSLLLPIYHMVVVTQSLLVTQCKTLAIQPNQLVMSVCFIFSDHSNYPCQFPGFKIVQICLIFSPVSRQRNDDHEVYCYVEDFKFSSLPEHMENSLFKPSMDINMFVLHHYHRTDRTRVGDIISLSSIREIVELVPIFGKSMPPHVNCDNSLELLDVFYLNNFVNKEVFHAILSYQ